MACTEECHQGLAAAEAGAPGPCGPDGPESAATAAVSVQPGRHSPYYRRTLGALLYGLSGRAQQLASNAR